MKWLHVLFKDNYLKLKEDLPLNFVKDYDKKSLKVNESCLVFWSPDSDEEPTDILSKGNTIRVWDKLKPKPDKPVAAWYSATILLIADSKQELEKRMSNKRVRLPVRTSSDLTSSSSKHKRQSESKHEVKPKKQKRELLAKGRNHNLLMLSQDKSSKKLEKKSKSDTEDINSNANRRDEEECSKAQKDSCGLKTTIKPAESGQHSSKSECGGKRKKEFTDGKKEDSVFSDALERSKSGLQVLCEAEGTKDKVKPKPVTVSDRSDAEDSTGDSSTEDDFKSESSDVPADLYNAVTEKLKDKQKKIICLEKKLLQSNEEVKEWEDKANKVLVKMGAEVLQYKNKCTDLERKVEELTKKNTNLASLNSDLMLNMLSFDSSSSDTKAPRSPVPTTSSYDAEQSYEKTHDEKGSPKLFEPSRPKQDGDPVEMKDMCTPVTVFPVVRDDDETEFSESEKEANTSSFEANNSSPLQSLDDMDLCKLKAFQTAYDALPKSGKSWELSPKQVIQLVSLFERKKGPKEDSRFVKQAADLLWTRKEQYHRSARGFVGPQEEPRPEMTPDKKD